MVEGPGSVGPRGFRRSSPPPNGMARKLRSPQELQRLIEQGLETAKDGLAKGEIYIAAVSFSTVARRCMDRSRIGDREAAIEWLRRSIEPRARAIELFQRVGCRLDEALDHSFLGKAHSRLGVIQKDKRLLARGVFERTLALELFRDLGAVKLEGEELRFLADDFRAIGWLETDPQIKRYIFLKASGYSNAALQLYPQYLEGKELEGRKLHEESYSILANGRAALCAKDPAEILAAKNKCLAMFDRIMKRGWNRLAYRLKENARQLDALLVSLSFSVSP